MYYHHPMDRYRYSPARPLKRIAGFALGLALFVIVFKVLMFLLAASIFMGILYFAYKGIVLSAGRSRMHLAYHQNPQSLQYGQWRPTEPLTFAHGNHYSRGRQIEVL